MRRRMQSSGSTLVLRSSKTTRFGTNHAQWRVPCLCSQTARVGPGPSRRGKKTPPRPRLSSSPVRRAVYNRIRNSRGSPWFFLFFFFFPKPFFPCRGTILHRSGMGPVEFSKRFPSRSKSKSPKKWRSSDNRIADKTESAACDRMVVVEKARMISNARGFRWFSDSKTQAHIGVFWRITAALPIRTEPNNTRSDSP